MTDNVKLMRQSTIGAGIICHERLRQRFWFNPDRVIVTEEALSGTVFHAICEAHAYWQRDGIDYDSFEIGYKASNAEVDKADKVHWREEKDGTIGDIDRATERGIAGAEWYIKNHWFADPSTYTIVGIEQSFTLPWIDGWEAHGTTDLVLMDANGWLTIVDYKFPRTAKRPGWERARNNPQMAWYFRWFPEWWRRTYPEDYAREGDRPIRGRYEVVAWGARNGIRHDTFPAFVSAVEMAHVMDMAERYAKLIDQGPIGHWIPSTDSHLCHHKWCDFWDVCPSGEELNNQ